MSQWFEEKKNTIDQLESLLKGVSKAVDSLVKHREGKLYSLFMLVVILLSLVDVADTTLEFGDAIFNLAASEINKNSEKYLTGFGEVQKKLKAVHDSQARSDIFYLANMMDEYLRLIGSIRVSCYYCNLTLIYRFLECIYCTLQGLSCLADG